MTSEQTKAEQSTPQPYHYNGAPYPPHGPYPPFFAYPPPQPDAEGNGTPQYMVIPPPPPGMIYAFPPPPPGQPFPVPPVTNPPNTAPAAPTRPKRKQVKTACTNCATACKRCDEARPCERCLKYGIADTCVDGQRKERKKGIKRGPYKRKAKAGNGNYSVVSTDGAEWSGANTAPTPASTPHTPFPAPEGYLPVYYPPAFLPVPENQSSTQEGSNTNNHPPVMPYYYPSYPYPHPYGLVPQPLPGGQPQQSNGTTKTPDDSRNDRTTDGATQKKPRATRKATRKKDDTGTRDDSDSATT